MQEFADSDRVPPVCLWPSGTVTRLKLDGNTVTVYKAGKPEDYYTLS